MTRSEYTDILCAIDTVENMEKTYCARYIEHNPQDKERRERDKDLVLCGLMHLRYELERRFKNRIA